ncbi:A-kinase anchor protein 12 isoform X1 [Hyperolius riggenbachi]|uniref:A-kinase anchor protein 12 isoform X1 n=1 Tax=Hyperolius riggenbachi TaxID=752182 RepID=UPI0035A33C9E
MGAGTSAEQVAEKPGEEQAEQSNDLGQLEQAVEEVAESVDAKLLHKNGKFAIINGTAGDEEAAEASVQAEDANGLQEEVVDKTVEQPEPAKVTLNGEQEENMEVVPNSTTAKENGREDGQVEAPETIEAAPVSEAKTESPEQANETQSSEVGFKKVFKFVGFKFTVKKEKVEKTEPVQLLTVKKDEAEVNGTSNHEEHVDTTDEGKTETQQETKNIVQQTESPADAPQDVESPCEGPTEAQNKEASPTVAQNKEESPTEEQNKEASPTEEQNKASPTEEQNKEASPNEPQKKEAEVEKDKKSPESPTNTVVTETSSPFRRFFTQGWAGLRKKTSFKKSKEEDHQEVEKHINIEQKEKTEISEVLKEETTKEITEEQSVPEDLSLAASEEQTENNTEISLEEFKAEEAVPDKTEEQNTDETVKVDEVIESEELKVEIVPEDVTTAPCQSVEVKADTETLEVGLESQITTTITPSVEVTNELQPEAARESDAPAIDQLISSTESTEQEKSQEVIITEAELLSSQEKVKVQGSPLKKLFSSSGLRKLSGKKSKSKKEDDTKIDTTAEPASASAESPEAAELDGGDSSPSSPDESGETSPTEKLAEEGPQTTETEGEGATSDGERKKDGITPWASFKKLVTPKRRPKRPSESDKEDEPEKAKTSTMSSTDSAGSAENQEETKETVEDQKLEKSTEENKKKADSSVSWDALICVGSSKKRARKTSDSDEEEVQKSQEESKKAEGEAVQTKEVDSESPITSSQEQQVQESPSPDQASSPTEGDGVSTWQSFKRLVTPRRKSRTKVEEKIDETAAGSNAEQSTSEGEAGKEESWVSFKKLIPGRKKKKSDAKQEQAPFSADQQVNENAEDDSDEPAVVPLAEFDAAELEKLDAQKSLVESLPIDVSGEPNMSLEKPSEELIHAVTVTLIEGERAVTSLEERSPSWISAKVAETIEHAKEVEETTEKIKTEITIEETVVFSTVSQVMSEAQSALINEVELTSEALTALEEAIETSCAEETTEMLTAVSQLGESVVSTEQATPVPEEEDVSVNNLKEEKQHVDDILYAVAESAKLASDFLHQETGNINVVSNVPLNLECEIQEINTGDGIAILTKNIALESIEEEIKTSFSLPAEQDVEAVIIAVTEKVLECDSIALKEIVQDTSEQKVEEFVEESIKESSFVFIQNQAVAHIDKDKFVSVIEKVSESTIITATDQDTESLSVSAEKQSEKYVGYVSTEKLVEDLETCAEVTIETLESSNTEAVLVEELSTNLESISIESSEGKAEAPFSSPVHSEKDSKMEIPFAVESSEEVAISLENQLHTDENPSSSLNVHVEEIVCSKVQAELSEPLSKEVNLEEKALLLNELQSEKAFAVSETEQTEETLIKLSKEMVAEVLPMSSEVPAKQYSAVSLEVKINEGANVKGEADAVESASTEVQVEESSPVSREVQADEGVPMVEESSTLESKLQSKEVALVTVEEQSAEGVSNDVHSEEDIHVVTDVQGEKDASLSMEVQSKEALSVTAEVLAEESVSEAELQAEDGALVTVEVKVEESSPKTTKLQTVDYVSVTDEMQAEESVVVAAKAPEENIVVSSEVLTEKGTPVPCDMLDSEYVTVETELKADEDVSVLTDVQSEEGVCVLTDFKVQESDVQGEFISMANKVEIAVLSFLTEEKSEGALPVSSERKVEESATAHAHSETEDTSVSAKIEDEEITDELAKGLVEKEAIEEKAKEDVLVPDETQAIEVASISAVRQSEIDMPSKEQAEDVLILPAEEPTAGTKEQVEEVIILSAEEPTADTKEKAEDVVILSAEEPTADTKEQDEDVVILTTEEPTAGTKEQVENVIILSAEEPTADTKEQAEDVIVTAEEPTAGTKEQAEDVISLPTEEPTADTKEQAEDVILTAEEPTAGTKEQIEDVIVLPAKESTADTKEQAEDVVILTAEEPTADTKEEAEDVISTAEEPPAGTKEQAEDVIVLPAEEPTADTKEQAENVVILTAEEPTADTKVQAEDVVILTAEEPTADTKVQAEDVIILTAEEPTADTKVQAEDVVILTAEEPTAGTKVQAEEHTGSTTESTEKEVPVSDEPQAEQHVPEAHAEEVADAVEVGNEEKFSNEMQRECFLNKEDSEVNVLSVNDEGEKESGSCQDKEQPKECIEISAIENVIAVLDIDTSGSCAVSDPLDINVMPSLPPHEDTVESGDHTDESDVAKTDSATLKTEVILDQLSLVQEEVTEVKEEVITSDIPEIESSEASKTSEPVTAAFVEERVLGETVKPIETTADNIQIFEETGENLPSEEVTSEDLHTVVETVTQKAAAIVDAAIEAATNCFVVDASSQDETIIKTTLCTEELREETTVETVIVESHSITTVENVTETTEKRVVQIILDVDCNSVEEQNEASFEHVSQVQEPEPSCKPINVDISTASEEQERQGVSGLDDSQKDLFVVRVEVQNKSDESEASDLNKSLTKQCSVTQATNLVNQESAETPLTPKNEIKPLTPTDIQEEDIHKTTTKTESSDTSTQEKAQTVES